ncbi:unnamed protein product [Vitrella brassicaformis CCMP3155]|uniref:TLDc domain-containing protein n=1 Tax=Vitrella brassicaformis (strain CCMP3155) TaxID=1169540 RepID=A0A0G4GTB3_VITBC|nr:unnamed protein product [Vitrella brassicaformis CCMP3155]|eukprot:CEM34008.1 unnamed protein product [Vitrella brassicaformis CCMP3155]
MLNRCTAVLVLLCVASACGQTETRHAEQVRLRGLQVTPPNGTSLSASEYEGLLGLLGGNGATRLISLYRTSVHGTTYGDLLDNVGDTKPLVFVVRKDKYVFGAFISEGIQLPDDPTSSHVYDSDYVREPGRVGTIDEDLWIGGQGWSGGALSLGIPTDIRICSQFTPSKYVPAGYMGKRFQLDGDAFLGGSYEFMADEIEVLQVVQ